MLLRKYIVATAALFALCMSASCKQEKSFSDKEYAYLFGNMWTSVEAPSLGTVIPELEAKTENPIYFTESGQMVVLRRENGTYKTDISLPFHLDRGKNAIMIVAGEDEYTFRIHILADSHITLSHEDVDDYIVYIGDDLPSGL